MVVPFFVVLPLEDEVLDHAPVRVRRDALSDAEPDEQRLRLAVAVLSSLPPV